MMFNQVFYIRDPATGLYWDGGVPGKFIQNPERFWVSREDAEARFAAYMKYQAGLKNSKLPLALDLEEFDVSIRFTATTKINTSTHSREFFQGSIRREFGLAKWGSPYSGLIYLIEREKAPDKIQYWCKLTDHPQRIAKQSGNPALVEMVERRGVCVKISLSSNPWIGLRDDVDFAFLKMATPIILTVITADYLK